MSTRRLTTSIAVAVLGLALALSTSAAPLFIYHGSPTSGSTMTVTFNDSKTLSLYVPTASVTSVGDYIDGTTGCDEITSTTFECDLTGAAGMVALPWTYFGGVPRTIYYDDGQALGYNEKWHRFTDADDGQKFVVALPVGQDDEFEDAIEANGVYQQNCCRVIDENDRVVDCGGLCNGCLCIVITSIGSPALRVRGAVDFLF